MPGVVGREVQTLVGVGLLCVYHGFHTAISMFGKCCINEWNAVVFSILSCECYATCGVDRVVIPLPCMCELDK